MKFEVLDKSEYVTKIFSVEDENGNEYIVRIMENDTHDSIEVESLEEGLLDEDNPIWKELVDLCENHTD